MKDSRNKGKEYNSEGDLLYEGEFLRNEKDGIGKEYNKKENSVFEGKFISGRRSEGKLYVNGKLIFEG